MKKKSPFNQEMAIRGANRRLFARSPFVIKKLEESRQEFPRYKKDGTRHKRNWVKRQCEVCLQWVSSTKIAVDHIDPVVPPEGFPNHFDMWDRVFVFLRRLWCETPNLQRICSACHDQKTYKERIDRLVKKYTEELDNLEKSIQTDMQLNKGDALKLHLNSLKKYIAKKKTTELHAIVDRAKQLKEKISRYK